MTSLDASQLLLGIIASVTAAENDSQTVKDNVTLEPTFHEALGELSRINGALSMVSDQASKQITPSLKSCDTITESLKSCDTITESLKSCNTITESLKSCDTIAESLKIVLNKVSQAPAKDSNQVYVAYVKQNGRNYLVEVLIIRLMEHVCEMTKHYDIAGKAQELLTSFQAAIKRLKEMKPSVPEKQTATFHFSNDSNGNQFNTTGGRQYNATGNGPQINGSRFSGGVTFN